MDISNRTLAMFLVAAVVVSLVGTIFSLNRLNTLSVAGTGFATTTGTAQVVINSTASLVFTVNSIDFGSGNVNTSGASYNNCTMYANLSGSAGFKEVVAACIGFVSSMPSPFYIENDGNLPLNVTLNASKNATQFFGTAGLNVGHPYPLFQYIVGNNETNSCTGGILAATSWTNVNDSGPGTPICNSFEYVNTNDTLFVGVKILIPDDAPSGTKTATFTATGTNP